MSAYSYAAGHIWPYKLVHHMFSKAIRRGVNLQTETTVTQIPNKPDSEGVWSLQTNRGVIRTKKVIVATNAYTPALLPEYKERIIPYKAICCRIECPKGRAPLLANTYALRFADWDFDYLIPRPDGSIIVGGARSRYLHDKAAWYGNTDDSTLVGQAKDYFDGYMQRHFKGWEHSGAHVSHIWTGSKSILAFPRHGGFCSDTRTQSWAIPATASHGWARYQIGQAYSSWPALRATACLRSSSRLRDWHE